MLVIFCSTEFRISRSYR